MHLDRRGVLRSLGTAAALGVAGPPLVSAWRRADSRASGLQRLEGFRGRVGASGSGAAAASAATVTEPRAAARPFSLVGVTVPPGASVEVRVSDDGERFGPWLPARAQGAEGEGPEGEEDARAGDWRRKSAPVWTGAATWLQLRVAGADPADIAATLIDADSRRGDASVAAASAFTGPRVRPALWRTDLEEPDTVVPASSGLKIVTRDEWGADESIRRNEDARYADRVHHGVIHHTAGRNDYAPADGPAIVRGIYRYHVEGNGWDDIGYNLLVDRYGVVYEGRYGGLDRAVIGAHARGANTGSFGISLIGDFRYEDPPEEMRWALFEALVWKFNLHAILPEGEVITASGQEGVPTLSGHRDVGSTSCPGDHVHWRIKHWREALEDRVDASGFNDIAGHDHEKAIRDLRAAGVTNGYSDGSYRPDEHVTRAQMATFLTRAVPLQPGEDVSFTDVTEAHPHYPGIAAAAAAGVAEGRSSGAFRPSNDVTRGQMASFLARALGLEPRDGETFSDVSADHPHYGQIEAVAHAEVAYGKEDGTYQPDREVTRGQMAAFLVRAFGLAREPEDPEDEDPEDENPDDGSADDGDSDGEGSDPDGSTDGEDGTGSTDGEDGTGSTDGEDGTGSTDGEVVEAGPVPRRATGPLGV